MGRGGGRLPGGAGGVREAPDALQRGAGRARLALLLARQGRTEELKRLSAELVTAFESRAIHREATAAFLLFQRACDEERATAEMISRLAALRRRGNGTAG